MLPGIFFVFSFWINHKLSFPSNSNHDSAKFLKGLKERSWELKLVLSFTAVFFLCPLQAVLVFGSDWNVWSRGRPRPRTGRSSSVPGVGVAGSDWTHRGGRMWNWTSYAPQPSNIFIFTSPAMKLKKNISNRESYWLPFHTSNKYQCCMLSS